MCRPSGAHIDFLSNPLLYAAGSVITRRRRSHFFVPKPTLWLRASVVGLNFSALWRNDSHGRSLGNHWSALGHIGIEAYDLAGMRRLQIHLAGQHVDPARIAQQRLFELQVAIELHQAVMLGLLRFNLVAV